MELIKCIHTTPLNELLLERGIYFDVKDRKFNAYMLSKKGIDLGYYSADAAHKKFILNENNRIR
mgnify:CR=1 FL=1|tara:strand:- start:17093 stop:17284 length:192 start_codon:yes stop_codon:yes gene_type:complete